MHHRKYLIFSGVAKMIISRCAVLALLALVLLPVKNASAQASDTPWQIGVVTEDLAKLDTTVAVSNSGASSSIAFPNQNGAICVNVYATSAPQSAIAACCTCRVQANGLREFSVAQDVLVRAAMDRNDDSGGGSIGAIDGRASIRSCLVVVLRVVSQLPDLESLGAAVAV